MRRLQLGLVLLGLWVMCASSASAAPFAYITNSSTNDVSVIDVATNSIVATVHMDLGPAGVAVSPDGTRVYTTNMANNTVGVIDATTNTPITSIQVGTLPLGVAVHPAGTRVYVASLLATTDLGFGAMTVIDAASNMILTTVPVPFPYGVAVNRAGTRVYVTLFGNNQVAVIDPATNLKVGMIPVGSSPSGVALKPDGTRLYVTNQGSNDVAVIDATNDTFVRSVPVGTQPLGLAVSPDGTRLYVANNGSNNVWVLDTASLDTASNAVVAMVPVGPQPYGLAVTPDGSKVYVANFLGNDVTVIDAATNTVAGTMTVGSGPKAFGMFMTPATTKYTFIGFLPPVDNNVLNERKAGAAVPLKWHLVDASGNFVDSLGAVLGTKIGQIPCTGGTLTNVTDAGSVGGGLRIEPGTHQFMFNWKTPKDSAGSCYRFMLLLNDGSTHSVDFFLK